MPTYSCIESGQTRQEDLLKKDTKGINQRIRKEAGQAWGHQEQRQRSKQPGKRPLRPEAGSEPGDEGQTLGLQVTSLHV